MNAVIFDMDGVLLDSEPLHAQADREMLGRLGIEVEPGYLVRFVGVTAPVMWAEILDEKRVSADLSELLNASLSIKLKLLKKGEYAPIEGVVPLLAELYRKHVPVVIASSSRQRSTTTISSSSRASSPSTATKPNHRSPQHCSSSGRPRRRSSPR